MISPLSQPSDAGCDSQHQASQRFLKPNVPVRRFAVSRYRQNPVFRMQNRRIARMLTRRTLVLLPILLGIAMSGRMGNAQSQNNAASVVTIVSANGEHRFNVELAETPAQMEQGLMFRRELAPDAGMLFDFKKPTMATMWMRNTLIPLDMLFVDAQGRIVNIQERAVPQSDAIIAAAAPVRVVIELNGGTAARLGIEPGDRVLSPIFGSGS
jgi:uncharacterized protein